MSNYWLDKDKKSIWDFESALAEVLRFAPNDSKYVRIIEVKSLGEIRDRKNLKYLTEENVTKLLA